MCPWRCFEPWLFFNILNFSTEIITHMPPMALKKLQTTISLNPICLNLFTKIFQIPNQFLPLIPLSLPCHIQTNKLYTWPIVVYIKIYNFAKNKGILCICFAKILIHVWVKVRANVYQLQCIYMMDINKQKVRCIEMCILFAKVWHIGESRRNN